MTQTSSKYYTVFWCISIKTVNSSTHTCNSGITSRMGKVNLEDNDTKEKKTEFSLVRVKSTWTRKLGKKVNKDTVDCISAAKM